MKRELIPLNPLRVLATSGGHSDLVRRRWTRTRGGVCVENERHRVCVATSVRHRRRL